MDTLLVFLAGGFTGCILASGVILFAAWAYRAGEQDGKP